MKLSFQILLLLFLFEDSFACEFKWEQLPVKTPLFDQMSRPQGLTYFKNNLVLSNHFKDSKGHSEQPSKLYFFKVPDFKIEATLTFPENFHHVGGLAAQGDNLYGVDFDESGVFKIDVPSSLKTGKVKVERAFDIETRGLSGLSIHENLLAVSYYMHPLRKPFLKDRFIQFYDVTTGKKINFSGEIRGSNYSQGLAFFRKNEKLYLAETINDFENTLKYKITGYDYKPDVLRLYSIQFDSKEIKLISETSIPATMAEDLTFDGNYLYTTDEQDFHFYRSSIINCQ